MTRSRRPSPHAVPSFAFLGVSVATTYRFQVPEPLGGWALCTVNDATGELTIQSDWGSWAYPWSPNPKHLGSPSLTHFIGGRQMCHYLADKLASGSGGPRPGEEFDIDATVERLREKLCATRLEQARSWIEYYRDDVDADVPNVLLTPPAWAETKPYYDHYNSRGEPLTAGIAREIWDQIGSLRDCGRSSDLFLERFYRIPGTKWLTEEPWEELVFAPTFAYQVLLGGILPALVAACAAEMQRRDAPVILQAEVQS